MGGLLGIVVLWQLKWVVLAWILGAIFYDDIKQDVKKVIEEFKTKK